MSALSKLLPQHQEDLRKSGLTDETIAKYEFASINQEEASRLLGFSAPSGGWIVKYPKSANFRFKPDNPWDPKQKYLSPKIPLELFITHLAEDAIKDTTIDLFFTEGEKKAIALAQAGYAAISLPGVTAYGSISVMNQLPQLNLQGRTVYLVYDSDKYFNDQVKKAQQRFAEILTKFGAKVKIINIDPTNGKGIDDQLVKKVDFNYYIDSAEDYSESIKNKPIISPPELLSNFLKRNIPPVEFYADGWVQKQGRMCISAPTNIGKTLCVQNLTLSIAADHIKFLNKFRLEKARIFYLDLEMGESPLHQRFKTMCVKDNLVDINDLFVKSFSSVDFLDQDFQEWIEAQIVDLKINIIVVDPLGNAWCGDENNAQEVRTLTTYLNSLILRFNISIIVIHHWRKSKKDFTHGGEMAAGSYAWTGWFDTHVTLNGTPDSVIVSCEKQRNRARFKSFIIKLNPETLWFEFVTDYEKKFTVTTAIQVFDSFGLVEVPMADLCKRAASDKICSKNTLRNLINENHDVFSFKKVGKSLIVSKKMVIDNDLFDQKGVLDEV